MTKSETTILNSNPKDFLKEFDSRIQNNREIKETKPLLAETASTRDFSSIFARLKKSARKKSAGIL